MKTYSFVVIIVMALGLLACEKFTVESPEELSPSFAVDYLVGPSKKTITVYQRSF